MSTDRPIPEDGAIRAAHPTRSGRHDLYAEAMRLVGAKHSKSALVDLVNWLLLRLAGTSEAAASPATRNDFRELVDPGESKSDAAASGAPGAEPARCCASEHEPSDTACKTFLVGMNSRCVYCDHESKCHPGPGATCEIGRAEPPTEKEPAE